MADVVGWVAGPTERGTLSLVWSCLITIFACTWTVLHLNVPAYHDKPRTLVLRKLKWMVINILFPEFILSKAICDLRMALHELLEFDSYLRECKQDITWTMKLKRDMGYREYCKWSWRVEILSGWSSLLFDLFRLPRTLPLLQQPDDQQPNTASSSKPFMGSAAIPVPFTGLKTVDSATYTEGEPLGKQHGRQGGPQVPCRLQVPGQATQVHENTEEGFQRPSEIHRAPLKEHQLHSIDSNTCDLNADTPGQDRSGIDETDFEKGPTIQDRHAMGTKTQIASSQETRGLLNTEVDSQNRVWDHREQKWTITHSYYAQMGGLVSFTCGHFDPCIDKTVEIITTPKLTRREIDPKDDHPLKHLILEKEDIEDKSKADWLLKTLAILQVTWLVLNVIVRHATGLPITQLEVVTVAFAIMAVLTYLANWWKPKDVSRPTVLQFNGELSKKYSNSTRDCRQSFTQRLRAPDQAKIDANMREVDVQRIGNDVVWLEGETPLLYYLMAGSSLVFGGLHCLAWDFEFPTRVELICWRAASVSSAVLPVVTLANSAFLGYLMTSYLRKQFESKWLAKLKSKFGDHTHSMWCDIFLRPQLISDLCEQSSLCEQSPLCMVQRRPAESEWEIPSSSKGPYIHMAFGPEKNALIEFQGDISWSFSGSFPRQSVVTPSQWEFLRAKCETFAENNSPNLKRCDPCGQTATCLEDFFKVTKDTATWAVTFEEWFRRASKAVFIMSLILYAACRLIILVVLFTSLRAVPADVYQNTVWTRFLPSFS